jgi:hypothetical protein
MLEVFLQHESSWLKHMPWFASLCHWTSSLVICCECKQVHGVAYDERNIRCEEKKCARIHD